MAKKKLMQEPMQEVVQEVQKQPNVDSNLDNTNSVDATEFIGRIGKIGKEEVEKAAKTLQKYKDGKANLDKRIIENEQWFKIRHWELIRDNAKSNQPEPTSAWLLNSLLNKHADAMDNYPEPNILPREEGDKEDAKQLSSIIPVILEQNDYENTYDAKWWQKLKNGTSVEGTFWNNDKNNGLGDIEIRNIDILNLFWQPGIKDIQKSRNLFHIDLVDNEDLEVMYPFLKGTLGKSLIEKAEYVHDESIDTTDKTVVVDWYYKQRVKTDIGSKQVLHYCKFCNGEVIYASENDTEYAERGFYDHGEYPFDFDVLFPLEDSPCGFGYVDLMKSPQLYIDKLNQILMVNASMAGTPRYFTRSDGSINEKEFADTTKTFVHTDGGLGEDSIRAIQIQPLPNTVIELLNQKIDELKETSGNRDFSQGGTTAGVTAASAIAALQEAGSKLSRDMIKASYRSFTRTTYRCIELVRQFYTEPRSFRITGEKGEEEFTLYDNGGISPQAQGSAFGIDLGTRVPIFDIKVRAQKSNPFAKIAQNELAKELYGLGLFNPEMADQALIVLDMMDFEGKDAIVQKISQNSMLLKQLQMMQQQMLQLAQIVDMQNGSTIAQGMAMEGGIPGQPLPTGGDSNTVMETNPLGRAFQTSKNNTSTTAKERAVNVSKPS